MPTADDDEFNRIIKDGYTVTSTAEHLDETPYGPTPATGPARKAGLTRRGKAALGVGAAVIAGSTLIGYQAYAANTAASEARAQEIALQSQALELAKLREVNRAAETSRTVEADKAKARQASIDTCVKTHTDQTGKGYGTASYRQVVDGCQDQYPALADSADMQSAATATSTQTGGSGGVNEGLLIGAGVLVLFVVAAAKKNTRSNPA